MIGSPQDHEWFLERYSVLKSAWAGKTDRLHKRKLAALDRLTTQPRIADRALVTGWKYHILLLKVDQLESAESIEQIDEILLEAKDNPKLVHIPMHSRYWLLEEEALFWMEKSLESPLSEDGFTRYMYVFHQLCEKYGKLPEYESIMGAS